MDSHELGRWQVTVDLGGRGRQPMELVADERGLDLITDSGHAALGLDYEDMVDLEQHAGAAGLIYLDPDGCQLRLLLYPGAGDLDPDGATRRLIAELEALLDRFTEVVDEVAEPEEPSPGPADGSTPVAITIKGVGPDEQGDQDVAALRFDRADYEEEEAGVGCCQTCQRSIVGQYYQVNQSPCCETCALDIRKAKVDKAGRFGRLGRALVFGTLAGSVGWLIYFGVAKITGYELGLVALVVGVLVGGGVRFGARGRGGRFYQALAALMTYITVTMTYVPLIVEGVDKTQQQELVKLQAKLDEMGIAGKARLVSSKEELDPSRDRAFIIKHSRLAVYGFAIATSLVWPVAGLFVEGLGMIMGLLIVGFAVWEAWRINRREPLEIDGPFQVQAETGGDVGRGAVVPS